MVSAADLIQALRKRGRRSLRPDVPPGEFPPGWARWLDAMAQRSGRITGATSEAMVVVLVQREPAMRPRRGAELSRWQAFATLWRQHWQPPEREDRRTRAAALLLTLIAHIGLLLLLLWLAAVRFSATPAQADDVVQVEFIGQGAPQDPGGGPPNGTPAPQPAAKARSPTVASAEQTHATATQPQPQPSARAPAPAPPAPPAPPPPAPPAPTAQPLQVSQTTTPQATFVLPPPTPRVVDLPQPPMTPTKLQAPVREVELTPPLPAVRALQPALPALSASAPQLRGPATRIEIIEPLPQVEKRALAERALPAPTLRRAPTAVPLREAATAPAPSAAPQAAAPATVASSAPPAATTVTQSSPADARSAQANPASASPANSGSPAARAAGQSPAIAAGRGPQTPAPPGAWPTPQRGDDWGASTRERPGGSPGEKPGLFNADGTPRLAPNGSGDEFPPGSDRWTRDQIDRAGTWLKRPPNDYTPTRFDQYWLPGGTLLDEWVRRGIREIAIPIPGTSKKIQCVISILQLGGGCGVSDPNLNDQEAAARPPPDVPFKPALQQDQDSLRAPSVR